MRAIVVVLIGLLAVAQGCGSVSLPDVALFGTTRRVLTDRAATRARNVDGSIGLRLTFRERPRDIPRRDVISRAPRFSPFPCGVVQLCRWEATERDRVTRSWEQRVAFSGRSE